MPRLFLAGIAGLLGMATLDLGCSPVCNPERACIIDEARLVCDGSQYRRCDETNRGLRITCSQRRRAVCTPDGWTIEDNT